jgi:filamentous hemagglutinin family protein
MMHHRLAVIGLSTGCVLGSWLETASAQIINNIAPDTTLGTENSIVTPDTPTLNRITGGATRGTNLFHSFQDLSIGTNQTAWFDNPTNIQSILVRVTGTNRSDIDGILRANGTADLFILNPNGIRFGQNAKLNIGGSLSAFTTPAIPLGEQGIFSAANPSQSQLLAVKPSALFDLAQLPPQQDITFNANWATQGQGITFVGKPIVMTGSITNTAHANATTLTLRSASDINLTKVQINNPTGKPLYIRDNTSAPVRLILEAGADRAGQGNITIQDADIGLYGGRFQATAPGKIVLERSRLLSQSFINNRAEPIAFEAGTVEIKGKSTKEAEASAITIATDQTIQTAQLVAPATLTIRAINPILIENTRINQPVKNAQGQNEPDLAPATFEPDRVPKRANFYPTQIILNSQQNITIKSSKIAPRSGLFQANTPKDFLFKNSQLFSDNYTNQASEPIAVQAQNITLEDPDGMSGNAIYGGRAADIILNAANNLTVQKDAGIGSNTINTGDAGNIILTAGNQLTVENGGFGNQSGSSKLKNNDPITGNNGKVIFNAKQISVKNYGINVESYGRGGGGQISLTAQENIKIGAGGANTKSVGSAQGAEIIIKAGKTLDMQPRSGLSSNAENQGQGGNIRVEAQAVSLKGSIATTTKGAKPAGNIGIESPQIILEQEVFARDPKQPTKTEAARGTISSYTGTTNEKGAKAIGKAGDITLTAIGPTGQIILRSGAGIANTSFSNSQGNTGNIVVRAGALNIQQGSQLIIATNGVGNPGLIDIDTTKSIQLVGTSNDGKSSSAILSTIRDQAKGVISQNIQIKSPKLEVTKGAGIIASTLGNGNSGNINIDANTLILNGKSPQGNANEPLTSGILTSVGISQLPSTGEGRIIQETNERGVTIATLRPLSRSANSTASGNSGNISLQVDKLDVTDDAQLVTAIFGAGQAGNLKIQAGGNIRLLDRGAIRADSGSGQGGSIDITGQSVVLLRRGGEISAVSRANGQDGNININVPFIVGIPTENSDIFAVSQDALNGGRSVGNNVKINAQGILGFAYRTQFTPQNDIIATGNVSLNLPDVDPSRGLTVLPTIPIDVTQKIDRSCNSDTAQSSTFVTRSMGGLPANPTTTIVPSGFIRLAQAPADRTVSDNAPPATTAIPIEAQTSVRLANGQIRFQSTTPSPIATNRRSDCLNRPDR